jgi:hypothetical protein
LKRLKGREEFFLNFGLKREKRGEIEDLRQQSF